MTGQSTLHDPVKRERLIESAAAVFSRVGFDRAAVEEIAQNADVAKGTVYLYFESKAELFLAVLYALRDELEHLVADTNVDSGSALVRFVRAHLDLADSSPDLLRCYTSALFGVNRDFQTAALEIFDWQQDRLATIIRRAHHEPSSWSKRHSSVWIACLNAAALVRGLTRSKQRGTDAEEELLLAMLPSDLR
jgi:AcrR family transcriptional regulator